MVANLAAVAASAGIIVLVDIVDVAAAAGVVDVVDVVAAEGTAPAVVVLAPDIFRSFLTTQLFFDNQIPVVIVVEISSTLVLLLSAFLRNLVP